MSKFLLRKSPEGSHGQRALLIVGMKGSANGNAKPTENCCSHLLDDECSNFRCGDNYGIERVRAPRQRLHMDPHRGHSQPYSSRADCMANRSASASTLRSAGQPIVSCEWSRKAQHMRFIAEDVIGLLT
jgi:hypothetical protein